jgi:nicotinate-nucleotide adenylyltransferase
MIGGIGMAKIGILGGTFNPPHLGHLIIAEDVLIKQKLDEIWFLPSSVPPHKQTETASEHRYEMVRQAIENHPSFRICSIEMEREGPSYTVDTMKQLKDRYSENVFYFIIGSDMVESLEKWYKIDELLSLVTFIAVKRPGHELRSTYLNQVIQVDTPLINLSSTEIRKRVSNKENFTYLVPPEVKQYIEEKKLYGSGNSA